MPSLKPTGAATGWRLIETRYPFKSGMMDVREDRIAMEGAGETSYIYAERAEAVVIVPVTRSGEIVMIRQYRYPLDEWCWEVPAGGCHDTGDMALEDVVRKELHEEIGATCGEVRALSWFYSAPSYCDEKCHVFLALDVELRDEPEPEETERIEVHRVPIAQALHMARAGEIKTGPCALALLLCEPLLPRS